MQRHLARVQATFAEVDRLLEWASSRPPISTLEFQKRNKQQKTHSSLYNKHLRGSLKQRFEVSQLPGEGIRLSCADWKLGWSIWHGAWKYDVREIHFKTDDPALLATLGKMADHRKNGATLYQCLDGGLFLRFAKSPGYPTKGHPYIARIDARDEWQEAEWKVKQKDDKTGAETTKTYGGWSKILVVHFMTMP